MNGLAHAAVPPITGPALDNKRVAAALIDLLVLFLVGFLLGVLSGGYTPAAGAVTLAWSLYYYFGLESLTGQTLGKKLMGLRVAQADGRPPEMRQVAIRTVLRVVDGLGLYLAGLLVMLATGDRRQRLGDLAAGTVVTTVEEVPLVPEAPPVLPLRSEEPVPVAEEDGPPAFEPYRPPAPAEEPKIELVPDPDAGSEQPRMRIVSPMDVVMGDDEPDGDDGPPPPQPA